MVSRRFSVIISTVCAGAGYYAGRKDAEDRQKDPNHQFVAYDSDNNCSGIGNQDETKTETSQTVPHWYRFLPHPVKVHAASASRNQGNALSPSSSTAAVITPTNRVGEIMRFGYPNLDNVRFYEDYVVAYDRRNRMAHWVFEHIRAENCQAANETCREKCNFKEDENVHPFFRARNVDYKGSGYDRGHLAAAANHRHCQKSMDQTFLLSNVAPQVGVGFNRGPWNDLEKYTRALARRNRCVYVCTGPLYLPRKEPNGKQYIKYEVIGANQVAVPTHFFKVLVVEDNQGQYEMKSFILPNEALPEGVQLKMYQQPVEAIERAAGFLLFEKIPRKGFKLLNGEKPR